MFIPTAEQANRLRQSGDYTAAIPLYEARCALGPEQATAWDFWGLAYCHYKLQAYATAWDVIQAGHSHWPNFPQLRSLGGWCLYHQRLKQPPEDVRQLAPLLAEIEPWLDPSDRFGPYARVCLKAAEMYAQARMYPEVLTWTDRLDPAQLDAQPAQSRLPNGKPLRLPSLREKYYSKRSEALMGTEAYAEARALARTALETLALPPEAAIWLRRRVALADYHLGDWAAAEAGLRPLLALRPDWFLRRELAQVLAAQGRQEEALQELAAALLAPGDITKKLPLLALACEWGGPAWAKHCTALIVALRAEQGWPIKEALATQAHSWGIDTSAPGPSAPLLKQVQALAQALLEPQDPPQQGIIKSLLPHGQAGFIQAGKNHYYFACADVQGDHTHLQPGVAVTFHLKAGFDRKKQRESLNAVKIHLSPSTN